jgi:LysR family transcriptional regulator, transcriptional activator of nhaA
MAELNFHHLRYFWAIAHERNLTKAAQRMHVSQSALSVQLRALEDRLGQALFERRGRSLVLTEAGRIALDHADAIFRSGEELVATLKGRGLQQRPVLRVGSVATLSRNFQLQWLQPILKDRQTQLQLHSGPLRDLLAQLAAHSLDVVLSNESVPRDRSAGWFCQRIAEQPLSLVSRPARKRAPPLQFPHGLQGQALLLPGAHSAVRSGFERLLADAGVRVEVLAEVDDMALLRLLARDTGALALVPPVVVQDELRSGVLVERCRIPGLQESFYAITMQRRFPHPALRAARLS